MNEAKVASIARQLGEKIAAHPAINLKVGKGVIVERIMKTIQTNLEQEQAIDAEAKKLLQAQLGGNAPGIDQHKMVLMIKKKLAEKKGFAL